MPILQRPNDEVTVTLPCEAHKPEPDRIQWRVRAISCADEIQYLRDFKDAIGLDVAEQATAINSLIKRVAIGWSNLLDSDGSPVPFTDDSLNLFSSQQKLVIAQQLPDAAGWGAVEKKA